MSAVLVAILLAAPLQLDEEEKLAVMPLQSGDLDENAMAVLNELLAVGVDELLNLNVISAQDIVAMLMNESTKQLLGCDDATCAAEIGGAIGAAYLLTGSARRLGGKMYITLTIIDTRAQEVRSRASAKVDDREENYERAVSQALHALLRIAPPEDSTGSVSVEGAGAQGELRPPSTYLDVSDYIEHSAWASYEEHAKAAADPLPLANWVATQNAESEALFWAEIGACGAVLPLFGAGGALLDEEGESTHWLAPVFLGAAAVAFVACPIMLLVDVFDVNSIEEKSAPPPSAFVAPNHGR